MSKQKKLTKKAKQEKASWKRRNERREPKQAAFKATTE